MLRLFCESRCPLTSGASHRQVSAADPSPSPAPAAQVLARVLHRDRGGLREMERQVHTRGARSNGLHAAGCPVRQLLALLERERKPLFVCFLCGAKVFVRRGRWEQGGVWRLAVEGKELYYVAPESSALPPPGGWQVADGGVAPPPKVLPGKGGAP